MEIGFSSLCDGFEQVSDTLFKCYHLTDEYLNSQLEILQSGVWKNATATGSASKSHNSVGAGPIAIAQPSSVDIGKVIEAWKHGHGQISKFGKSFDKKIKSDLTSIAPPTFAIMDAINKAILQHFYRLGEFSFTDLMINEANLITHESMANSNAKATYHEMHKLLSSLDQIQNASPVVEPTIDWLNQHSSQLGIQGNRLQFQVRAAQYLDLVRQGQVIEALQYGKEWFPKFVDVFMSDVQILLGALVYSRNLYNSPYYPSLAQHDLWKDLKTSLTLAYCKVMALPRQSSLETCVNIGTDALPKISRVLLLMKERKGVEWSQEDELPVEIELPKENKYHSIFTCPILRQQSSIENPPMMMPCGHVICKEALTRLSKGNNFIRFKCPYCPVESNPIQAHKVEF